MVTLTATDGESGVASIAYAINGGATNTVNAASTAFAIAAQGTITVTYRATDNAGNVEALKTLTVKLDNVASGRAMTFPNTGSASSLTWNGHCLNSVNAVANGLRGTASDASSGVVAVEYELRRIPVAGPTVCWNYAAGNVSAVVSPTHSFSVIV